MKVHSPSASTGAGPRVGGCHLGGSVSEYRRAETGVAGVVTARHGHH